MTDRSSADRRVVRYVTQPLARFLEIEAAAGVILVVATVAALVWANSPWDGAYRALWTHVVTLEGGPVSLSLDLRHWVNDGLMALFFFVVGLEIKRELVTGQLADRRDAALPALAAVGGMVVPAALFVAINAGGVGARGWGIAMATDIAFAMGVLALLGDRVPAALKVLLLGLAIADDIGAIVVIALFYTERISVGWLLAAGGALVVVVVIRRAGVWWIPAYVLVGVVVWACALESGVHATIAGVALGLRTPALPRAAADPRRDASESIAERLESALHPWTSFLVIPVFALANAGIPLSGGALADAASSRITLGVVLGLVVGKIVGVSGAAWLAVRLGLARLPDGLRWAHVVGMAAVAGVGFTVSIFVAGLAFGDAARQDEAKVGVVVASLLAAGLGSLVLARTSRSAADA